MAANVDFEFREEAFDRRMLTFAIVNRGHIDAVEFFDEASEYFENEIRSILQVRVSVKVNARFSVTFEKTEIGNVPTAAVDNIDAVEADAHENLVVNTVEPKKFERVI